MKLFKKIINNKLFLWLIITIVFINIINFVKEKSYDCLFVFFSVSFISLKYLKNIPLALSISIFISNFLFVCGKVIEAHTGWHWLGRPPIPGKHKSQGVKLPTLKNLPEAQPTKKKSKIIQKEIVPEDNEPSVVTISKPPESIQGSKGRNTEKGGKILSEQEIRIKNSLSTNTNNPWLKKYGIIRQTNKHSLPFKIEFTEKSKQENINDIDITQKSYNLDDTKILSQKIHPTKISEILDARYSIWLWYSSLKHLEKRLLENKEKERYKALQEYISTFEGTETYKNLMKYWSKPVITFT